MPFVTVKPKFQITIPAKLRKDIDLHEGDIMEAVLVGNSILFKPEQVVDRELAADRIAARFAEGQPASGDVGHGEGKVMDETIADIKASRRERRRYET